MDPIQPGANPANNPRLDLLHNTGNNQQLRGAAGSYGPDATAFHAQGVSPAPPTPAGPSKDAAAYVAAAQSRKPAEAAATPEPPAPVPEPRPAPAPKPVAPPPPPTSGGGRRGLIFLFILLVLIAGAGGAYYWWTHRAQVATPATVNVTPVTPTNPIQLDSTNTSIDAGATTSHSKLTFEFNVHTSANAGTLTPEVEVEPAGTAFTNQATLTGKAVAAASNMQFSVASAALTNGGYHWQARVSTGGQHSSWVVFGNDSKATAFTVNATAPTAPVVSTVGGAAVANPTVVTNNRPAIVGTAPAGATITVNVSPDSQKFTATADSSGNWTVTPSADIPNGQHQLSITATNDAGVASPATSVTLTINPATSADTTPSPAASPPPASPPAASSSSSTPTSSSSSAAATPTPSSNLAATGDNTAFTSLASLAIMLMAATAIMWMRRRYATR